MRQFIRNEAEHLAALERATDLLNNPRGVEEVHELARINEAIRIYEESVAVMKGVAQKAADGEEEAVAGLTGEE